MTTTTHKLHISARVSHSNCSECRADTERQFVDAQQWRYITFYPAIFDACAKVWNARGVVNG